nr:MAG TPA: DNA packaging protein [Bacteriophage sp.]
MAGIKLPQEIIDALAQQEANALLEGLQSPTMRRNPAFLAKVRQFLKDNDFITTTETEGVETIVRDMQNIPDLVNDAEVVH